MRMDTGYLKNTTTQQMSRNSSRPPIGLQPPREKATPRGGLSSPFKNNVHSFNELDTALTPNHTIESKF